MRDRMNVPIEWDASRNGYRYTEEVDAFPTLQITEGELFAQRLRSPEAMEAFQAFFQKRKPDFSKF